MLSKNTLYTAYIQYCRSGERQKRKGEEIKEGRETEQEKRNTSRKEFTSRKEVVG